MASPAPARRSWWPGVWVAAMAAGIAAIAVGLSVSAMLRKRLEALARGDACPGWKRSASGPSSRWSATPATQVVALAGLAPAPSARARMIWNAPQGGLLVAAGLPAAPPGKAYQLWAIAGKNAPVSAGVFEVGRDGAAACRVPPLPGVDKVDVFAVTLEPAGGVPAPTGPMYLAGRRSRWGRVPRGGGPRRSARPAADGSSPASDPGLAPPCGVQHGDDCH